ncbi:hypothetical protein H5410_061321 [Solanum commersonii]|uniref:RNase H family protein n=1 Tax=Solanum commersonii TaxID=4109 RepID=A0A9J5W7E3_SOLCO|nr:hypothetical protein H5410_061321 [Solanum commersonii]
MVRLNWDSHSSLKEEIAIIKEKLFDEDAFSENRIAMQRVNVEYNKYLHFEEIFSQQKVGYDWFENGDRNTKFFHNLVKGRRQKSRINRIENSHGDWLEEEGAIANEVVEYFDKKFQQEGDATSFSLLSYIFKAVSEEENTALCAFLVLEDVKKVVFKVSIDSASSPDRLTNDTIIFSSCNEYSLGIIMNILQEYEHQSGQKVNKDKSFFYLHQNVASRIQTLVEQCSWIFAPTTSRHPNLSPHEDIRELFNEEGWDFDDLQNVVLEHVVDHISHNMRYVQLSEVADKPWWTKSSTGDFSVKSVWEVLRKRKNVNEDLKSLWVIWQGKVHVANLMHAWNPNISQISRCCNIPKNETINHLIKIVFQAFPIVIMWFLWERRNTTLHGGTYYYLEGYKVVYNFKMVKWVPPPINWLKGNTDAASKRNPGPSSATFCIRDHEGNLIVAKGIRIRETTNLIAEAIDIRECLVFCRDNMLS